MPRFIRSTAIFAARTSRPTSFLFPQVQDDLLEGLANSDDGEILLGDIVLARETCVREAEEKGISIVDHARRT